MNIMPFIFRLLQIYVWKGEANNDKFFLRLFHKIHRKHCKTAQQDSKASFSSSSRRASTFGGGDLARDANALRDRLGKSLINWVSTCSNYFGVDVDYADYVDCAPGLAEAGCWCKAKGGRR